MESQENQQHSGHIETDSNSTHDVTTGQKENLSETDARLRSDFASLLTLDPVEEYRMDYNKRGQALIFNQENFNPQLKMKTRSGTEADRFNLVKRFEELGFDVKAYDDYKREQILKILTKAADANHADSDCFVCVFLSHGEKGYVYAYDDKIDIQEITSFFRGNKCKSLVGKPKIFIFQACRGDKHDDPVTEQDAGEITNEVVADAGALYTLPAGADFLMCYSVAEGYYSLRDKKIGSWYIQDLCEALRHHGSKLEFTELLTFVNRKVSMRSIKNCHDRSAIGKKQVPCFASMLTKKLYFRRKKGLYV